jgi:hypothetical protein
VDASEAGGAIEEGLRIARDCGFGIFHIDLLLERARLHLLRGDPGGALDDVRVALDDGRPGDERTGRPELLAANDRECGYAWAIPPGLHLRAEALLLRAARKLGRREFAPANKDKLPKPVLTLIQDATTLLTEALDWWRKLKDPESDA